MTSDSFDEGAPMLKAGEVQAPELHRSKSWFEKHRRYVFLQLLLICFYTIISVLVISIHRTSAQSTSLHTLDDLSIRYMPKVYSDFEDSIFSGLPSPQLDRSWHTLLKDITLRASAEELRKSNQSSVELPRGGYMVWLGVSHELHCIKMLRQWNYRSHYHPNLTATEQVHWDVHADHCLELLRSAAICHGDTTLTTFRWDTKEKPMLDTKLVPHKCVDWDSLTQSIQPRVVGEEEVRAMVNPLFNNSA